MSEPTLHLDDDGVRVAAASYTWTWDRASDLVTLADTRGRTIVTGPLQPAVVTTGGATTGSQGWSPGEVDGVEAGADGVTVGYAKVNGGDALTVRWRFEAERCWLGPVTVTLSGPADVVSLHWFARATGVETDEPAPGLHCRYLVHPGVSGSGVVSPLIHTQSKLDTTTWLGRGGGGIVRPRQQWGLPVHYVCGLGSTPHPVEPGALTTGLSDAFCLGLGALPAGDLLLRFRDERFSPVLQLRGDLWGHLRGPGTFELGAPLVWTVGADYTEAIRGYQRALVETGAVAVVPPSPRKEAAATASQYNTWGAQLAAGRASQRFDQEALDTIDAQLVASGLDVEMVVVDDKWEGEYGRLEHAADRFPEFEATLERIRGRGQLVGLWAAFLRCDDPATHGLTTADLLRGRDGEPIVLGPAEAPYFLFDVTRAGVRDVLRQRIAAFVARYRPALVKFDFGYEIPDLSICAPADPAYGGERLLGLALDVVVGALREADPDVVVMYYALSPLFAPYTDVHSVDDLWLNAHEYHAEAGRRIFFSRLLADLGVVTYGSGGYDWVHQPDIWLDSVAAGPLGMLGAFTRDLSDSTCPPSHVALHTGLSRLSRRSTRFRLDGVGCEPGGGLGPVTGARSSSWVRLEDGVPVLVVLRPHAYFGAPGVPEHGGLVATDVDVAVGILGDDGGDGGSGGLAGARRIGVVARHAGRVVLPFVAEGEPVAVVVHTLSGERAESERRGTADGLVLDLPAEVDGDLVTWVELTRG
ncbi:hypothetical protein [Jiangella mangrovi]|uniref:Alpha-galactosidase n=1 Tax=Jiangella mangrovi TaxID=1524084 RepID=A0A7W9GUT8_9ACTN|nr:hypothetical protein [Jiangella mangrovi]MBB5790179.1 hypothetical protein [Jiangella mangrovi]